MIRIAISQAAFDAIVNDAAQHLDQNVFARGE
jgi:hypothetical protein